MRHFKMACGLSLLVVCLSVASKLSGGKQIPATTPAATQDASPLVVHEWGTFTNFSGSDGVQLEFRPLAQHDLPGFVQTYLDKVGLSFRKGELQAFQRMETPVLYFYTPVERDVQVRVEFPEGLLTEFYPPVVKMTPGRPEDFADLWGKLQSPADLPLKNSSLDWGRVHLIPIDRLTPQVADPVLAKSMGRFLAQQLAPKADSHPHYAHARETDAALVNVHVPEGRRDYFEKFLFYRGLGNFTLPLAMEAESDQAYRLSNQGSDAIRSLFLVTVRNGEIRFSAYDRVEGTSSLALTAGAQVSPVEELAEAMAIALTNEGLYRKEADAMVNSWRDSWFAEEGTRLLYMVPQRITDELLPLEITPPPDEVVRVLVGRMEIMSPEEETRIVGLVQRSAQSRLAETQSGDAGGQSVGVQPSRARVAAFDELVALGRFAEPALVRVRYVATDEAVRNEAALLVSELRAKEEQRQ